MKTKIILCTGGARSGKSDFAERLALQLEGQKVYIATSIVYDSEIKERVRRHQDRRGPQWLNIEIPKQLSERWDEWSSKGDVFLIDCLTMYVINYLMDYNHYELVDNANAFEEKMLQEIESLIDHIKESTNKTFIFVTNEIGLGIVPADPMSRTYRDVLGEINQIIGKEAEEVYFTVSGITREIKKDACTI